jgi:hypothetical protein
VYFEMRLLLEHDVHEINPPIPSVRRRICVAAGVARGLASRARVLGG